MPSIEEPFAALSDYELLHIIPHLLTLDAPDVIDQLLRLETAGHLNALYQAKEARGVAPSYTSDLRLVLSSALLRGRDHVFGVVAQSRYALMLASAVSRSLTLPAKLVPILVERGVWSAADAMRFAEAIEDPVRRAETIVLLLPVLSEPAHALNILRRLLTTDVLDRLSYEARTDIDERLWGNDPSAARSNSSHTDDQSIPARAVQRIEQDEMRTSLDQLRSAVAGVSEDAGVPHYCRIGDLVRRIAASGACGEALKIARICPSGMIRVQMVAAMADHLPPRLLLTALNAIRFAQCDEEARQQLMLILLMKLAAAGKAKLAISETWTLAPRQHADFLIAIADRLDRAAVLAAVDRALDPHKWHYPLASDGDSQRLRALEGLAPRLAAVVGLEPAIAKLKQWPVTIERSLLMLSMASSAPAHIRTRLVTEGIRTAEDPKLLKANPRNERTGQWQSSEVFERAAPWMTTRQLRKALDVIFTFEGPQPRAIAISKLAPRLSTSLLSDTLSRIAETPDSATRIECLISVAPHLEETMLASDRNGVKGLTLNTISGPVWRGKVTRRSADARRQSPRRSCAAP